MTGKLSLIFGMVVAYLAIVVLIFGVIYFQRRSDKLELRRGCHLSSNDRRDDVKRIAADVESKDAAIKANEIVAHDPAQPSATRHARAHQAHVDRHLQRVNRRVLHNKRVRLKNTCEHRYPLPSVWPWIT
jgi:biopolymer transport protein ExbB/TolQ